MSVDPFSLFRESQFLAKASEGSVSRAVADASDGVYATADGQPGVEFGPMPWPYVALPNVGDRVLIMQGPYGNPWVASWDPFG